MRQKFAWQSDVTSPTAVPEIEIDGQRTALIVVDVQNYSQGNWKIAPNCMRLRDFFREKGLEVIYLRSARFCQTGETCTTGELSCGSSLPRRSLPMTSSRATRGIRSSTCSRLHPLN